MAAGLNEEKIEIENLEGTNDWWEWKYNITLQLKARKLWSQVDGTAILAGGASNDQREKFEHTAVRAQAMIVRGLSKQIISLVLACNGPKMVWERLVEEFEVKSVQNAMLLHTQVNNMRLKEGSSVREHLRDMKEMYDCLAMLDDKVNEKDQVINLLASLPPSYNALKSVLLARGPGITWTDVQQVVTLEEQQRQLQLTKKSSNVDRDSKEKVIQGAMRVEPVCFKCHQCPELQRSGRGRDSSHRGRGRGRNYKGRGHGKGWIHGAQRAESQDNTDEDAIFMAETAEESFSAKESERDRWLIDSGASRHMTNHKDQLSDYQEFNEKELVILGDGKKLEAFGKGNIKLQLVQCKTGINLQPSQRRNSH